MPFGSQNSSREWGQMGHAVSNEAPTGSPYEPAQVLAHVSRPAGGCANSHGLMLRWRQPRAASHTNVTTYVTTSLSRWAPDARNQSSAELAQIGPQSLVGHCGIPVTA